MHNSAGIYSHWPPLNIKGVDTCEDAIRQKDWTWNNIGIQCPQCQQLFLMCCKFYTDNFGYYKKVWGFCTNCKTKLEGMISI